MKYDIFFSISQTPVDGHTPSEAVMFQNFFEQVKHADTLGFDTAWVAESHLSTEVQKSHPRAVVPHWQGEIGLNTNLPLLASYVFHETKRIEVGSAVMNIVCMGGPVAAAEKIASMLALHGCNEDEKRRLHIGFSAGRFAFMNEASGIVPRNALERAAWPALRNRIFQEATEIFTQLLKGNTLSSDDIQPPNLVREDVWLNAECTSCGATWQAPHVARPHLRCRACGAQHPKVTEPLWDRMLAAHGSKTDAITFDRRWDFLPLKIVPADWRRELLQLVIGSHDPATQILANRHLPVQVFNLSITRPEVIEATHSRMREHYHASGGDWQRHYMPRTTFVFLNHDPHATPEQRSQRAHESARKALGAYWTALEGTLDPAKVEAAATNALIGNVDEVAEQIRQRFHPDDRLMLWFDFFNHDNAAVMRSMEWFTREVIPRVEGT